MPERTTALARYTRRPAETDETLYADGVVTSEIAKSRSHHVGRVPAFVGLAKANGGWYAENLDTGMTIERALQAAKLDYRVVVGQTIGRATFDEPMLTTEGVLSKIELTSKVHQSTIGIWPDGTGQIFGQTTKRYHVVQPAECGELGEEMLGYGHKLVAAGSYGVPLGSSMYLAFHIGDMTIGGEDRYDMYAHLLNSFNGHAGLHLAFAPIRFACTNQTAMNLGRHSQRMTIRHTGDIVDKVKSLKESLAETHQWAEKFEVAAEKLLATPMNTAEFVAFAEKLMQTPKTVKTEDGDARWQARRNQLIKVGLEAEHNRMGRGTRYGAYNAVTSVLDHDMWLNPTHDHGGARRATARWERALDGGDETRLKIEAGRLLLSGL